MTREEAIKEIKMWGIEAPRQKEVLEALIPELRESEDEDERIRKAIIGLIEELQRSDKYFAGVELTDMIAYLENQKPSFRQIHDSVMWDNGLRTGIELGKQKEQKQECGEKGLKGPQEIGDWRGDEGVCKKQKEQNGEDEECTDFTIYYPLKNGKGEYECIPYSFYDSLTFFSEDKDLIDFHRACFYTEEECNEWIEQHKEEEGYEAIPVESTLEYKLGFKAGKESEKQKEQRPEWNEEDEKMLDSIIRVVCGVGVQPNGLREKQVSWLKALRPQSKDEIYKEKDEAFKLGKHQLAIKFMNYLDENRPEGKMSLSNGECEDIDKAFKENDWPKIMRYVEKYSPQPKQEWGDEDSDNLERVDNYLWMLDRYVGDDCAMPQGKTDKIRGNIQEVLSPWLKSLPERFSPQPKQEWSKEDERIINGIQLVLESWDREHSSIAGLPSLIPSYISWLESRRPSWKPSKEQIKYLLMLADYFESEGGTNNAKTLREFSEDLRKLI